MKKTASAGTNWKYGSYFLEKSVNMSIILRATRSKLDVGDIAVDDFKINRGRCPTISKHNSYFIIIFYALKNKKDINLMRELLVK